MVIQITRQNSLFKSKIKDMVVGKGVVGKEWIAGIGQCLG